MEKFKEKEWVDVIRTISSILLIIWMFSALGLAFEHTRMVSLGIFFTVPLLIGVLLIIHSAFGTKDDYTRRFLKYYKIKEEECRTKEEFIDLYNEIYELSVEDGMIILSFPKDVKSLLKTIDDKVKLLNKLEK